jgi:hypothetical protein
VSLDDEAARYRKAAELTLKQLDWCVTYLHSIHKSKIARSLAKNSSAIADTLASIEGKRRS